MESSIEQPSTQQANLRALTKTFIGIEKPMQNAKVPNTLAELIAELHRVFEHDQVNIEYVNHLLLSYKSQPSEWKKFAKFDRYRYTRNLVDAGNGKFNLMLVCWGEGHGSAIHDHADAHCFMKMLQGELSEIRYAWPDASAAGLADPIGAESPETHIGSAQTGGEPEDAQNGAQLQEMSRSAMETNGVRYINDSLGLHRVENPSHTDVSVSLHLYCPPFESCSIFNKETGKRSRCKVTFWSKFGERRDKTATMTATPEDN